MAWPNPFRRKTEKTRTAWGYTFDLGPDHLTPEQAHPLKYSHDVLGEECLTILNELSPPSKCRSSESAGSKIPLAPDLPPADTPSPPPDPGTKPKRDLYLLLRDNHESHPKLHELWTSASNIPPWVDWTQIARGQDVFYRYGGATLTGLAYQSLLGGMGANRVVEVLSRTGGFSVKVARHRLFETTQHILECTRDLESIQPGGAGFASSLRVRLLHAAVRQRIMNLTRTRPSYYDVSRYGVPINDLDCIATIGTFSATIIYLSLPRQGIFITQQETEDYIALWRLIAHYTGTPTSFFSNPARAKAVMESLLLNEINPSPTSRTLATNIIRCLENQPPAYATRDFLEATARWLNGPELCDALGLGNPSLYYKTLVAGQCLLFMTLCYINRSIPYLDRRKIQALRHIFWQIIVEGKYGLQGDRTVFEFKHVPDFHVTTERGRDEKSGVTGRGVERESAITLGLAAVTMAMGAWVGVRVLKWVLG